VRENITYIANIKVFEECHTNWRADHYDKKKGLQVGTRGCFRSPWGRVLERRYCAMYQCDVHGILNERISTNLLFFINVREQCAQQMRLP
jgi:hypothetical protein